MSLVEFPNKGRTSIHDGKSSAEKLQYEIARNCAITGINMVINSHDTFQEARYFLQAKKILELTKQMIAVLKEE